MYQYILLILNPMCRLCIPQNHSPIVLQFHVGSVDLHIADSSPDLGGTSEYVHFDSALPLKASVFALEAYVLVPASELMVESDVLVFLHYFLVLFLHASVHLIKANNSPSQTVDGA